MKTRIFVVAAALFSSPLFGQPSTDTTGLAANVELTGIVVTASKFPSKQIETGKAMIVIPRSQIERSTGRSVSELLNTTAGTFVIGANNDYGTNQTVTMRGASAGNVLILIDGIPVNDPSVITNYFDLNLISVDQIERIEILKGGQSTLYGSDAVAGVINIITRKPVNKPWQINGNLAGGTYSTFKEGLGFSGMQKGFSYSMNYTHIHTNGFSAVTDELGTGNFDKDGYDQDIINGRYNIQLSKKLQAIISGSYSKYKNGLDGPGYDELDFTGKSKNAQAAVGLLYNHRKGAFRFNYSFDYVSREYEDDSTFKGSPFVDYSDSKFIGRTHFVEAYSNWQINRWQLLGGIDYRFNNTDQYSLYIYPGFPAPPSTLNAKMSQVSPYISMVYKNGKGFTGEFGSRWNHHSDYGDNVTFTFNPSYLINGKVKLFANLYTAFKTPTLYQLFDPSAGNADLKPEKGIIGELGVEVFTSKAFHARAIGFYRSTKNAILYVVTNATFFEAQYENAAIQENYGTELEASYDEGRWSVSANYTYTDGKTKSKIDGTGQSLGKDTSYYNLYRIPKNAINFRIGFQATKKLFLSSSLRTVGEREEFTYGGLPQKIDGYATVDIYGEYRFCKQLKAFGDFKNITNKKYFDIPGYNSKRFNFMAGVNFQF